MRTKRLTRSIVFVFFLTFSSLGTSVAVFAQSPNAQTLINRLLSTDKKKTARNLPRAKLARTIANDRNLSPKVRVNVLTAILREELENPCPGKIMADGWYVFPTVYLQKQYVFGLEDVGSRAIPHLRKHLVQLKLTVQNISPSLGNTDSVDTVEIQHTLCALGLLADKDVLKDLREVLEDEDGDGYVRQMAAVALGNIGDKSAIPALKRALKDDFHVNYKSLRQPATIYPVRGGAVSALKKFGFEFDLINDRQQWEYRIVKEP